MAVLGTSRLKSCTEILKKCQIKHNQSCNSLYIWINCVTVVSKTSCGMSHDQCSQWQYWQHCWWKWPPCTGNRWRCIKVSSHGYGIRPRIRQESWRTWLLWLYAAESARLPRSTTASRAAEQLPREVVSNTRSIASPAMKGASPTHREPRNC